MTRSCKRYARLLLTNVAIDSLQGPYLANDFLFLLTAAEVDRRRPRRIRIHNRASNIHTSLLLHTNVSDRAVADSHLG